MLIQFFKLSDRTKKNYYSSKLPIYLMHIKKLKFEKNSKSLTMKKFLENETNLKSNFKSY